MNTQTLIAQLGTALPMMGAKNLVASEHTLTFSIGRNGKGVNKISITLTPDDLYTVSAWNSRQGAVKGIEQGVYADSLHSVLESLTGLYTRL